MAKLAAARETQLIGPTPSVACIAGIVQAYLKRPEWARLAPRTKGDWRESHPSLRQGQMRMDVVSRLFSWARSRGMTTAPPTEPLERIYKADRSDIIWTESEVEKIRTHSDKTLQWAIQLAIETGLRQGDLITLPSAISDVAIRYRTAKRRKDVIIPITPALRKAQADIPKRSPVVLSSSTGSAWTGFGLHASFDAAKKRAGITGLRWHDFRGTAVTRLAKTDLTQRDIARIIG
jgi:integrase